MLRSLSIWVVVMGLFLLRENCFSLENFKTVEFNRDIRPILSDKCFSCHGPDANHRKANLRFDMRPGALSDLGGYAAVVPGSPEKSELISRIHTSKSSDELMPPLKSGKQLSETEKQLLQDWISQGAEYEEHWAYLQLQRPPIPKVMKSSWPKGAIDRFVMASLEHENVFPSKEADAEQNVR